LKLEKLADLIEQRTAAFDRMKAAQGGDADTFTAAETEVRDLNEKIRRARAIEAEDRADLGTPITGTGDEQLSRELRNFSLNRMIAHQCGMAVDAGREIEMQAELAKRAGGPAKGFYVPTEIFEKRVLTTGTAGTVAGHVPSRPVHQCADRHGCNHPPGRDYAVRPHRRRSYPARDGFPERRLGSRERGAFD
jgi:hypothetical protein